jgi:hypothetical protein
VPRKSTAEMTAELVVLVQADQVSHATDEFAGEESGG